MKKTINNNVNGITLIALVISIIVLLILAGVAISMLSGENGILKKAGEAKAKTDKASIEEQIRVATIAAITNPEHRLTNLQEELDKQLGEGKAIATQKNGIYIVTIGEKEYRVDSNGEIGEIENIDTATIASNRNRTLKDANGETFVIPANFKLSKNEDGTIIEDEITKGIVIEDSEANQYVWIPIFEKTTERTWGVDYSKVTSAEDWSNIEQALINSTNEYIVRKDGYLDEWYGDEDYGQYGYYDSNNKLQYYTNGNMTKMEYETLYHNMLKSVYKNGGFYIGRYEMGKMVVNSTIEAQNIMRTTMAEYKATSINTNNTEPSLRDMAAPLSKANAVVYNYITQSQAQMLAEKLKEKSDYSNVTSSIMFGVQWNAVCVFIEQYDKNNTTPTKSHWTSDNKYSKLWGNYFNSTFKMNRGFYNIYNNGFTGWYAATEKTSTNEKWLCTTGASDQNSSLNIYDFAGNEYEWTLEKHIDSILPCVVRGADFCTENYASIYGNGRTFYSHYAFSSRTSLFI